MTLADIKQAGRCTILEVAPHQADMQMRLYALGLYPGIDALVLRRAPAGDPLQIRCGNTLLAIRKSEAELIRVAREA